ncbi:MAG TPA: glycosyltransferase [Arachidicoccus sp.]
MNNKPLIVVSAIRFFQGGSVVIVNDCLAFLSKEFAAHYQIKALVFQKDLYGNFPNIDFIEFPNARKNIFLRLYYEYFHFYKLSKKWRPFLWFSMQDSTPKVKAEKQALYFHNPLLLCSKPIVLLRLQQRLFFLWLLYKTIYTRKINTNDFVIVQQQTLSAFLKKTYYLNDEKLLIFPPKITAYAIEHTTKQRGYIFIYPSTSLAYKNFKVIFEACELLKEKKASFKILLTISGNENSCIKKLRSQYDCAQIKYLGFIKREDLFCLYNEADCMIFPSLLETWGLPLSEFSLQNKPIICADLSYAKETLGNYKKVKFFDPNNAEALAANILQAINKELIFDKNEFEYSRPVINSWQEMFEKILAK